jgi:hypothetical protein
MRKIFALLKEETVEAIQYIPKTSLARKTHQVIQTVQRGQTVVVEHHGQPEAAIMDITDYYLLRAVSHYHATLPDIDPEKGLSDEAVATQESPQGQINLVIAHYLADSISLARTAELLNLPSIDLRTRFLRLDIPSRTGPSTPEEIAQDTANALAFSVPPR